MNKVLFYYLKKKIIIIIIIKYTNRIFESKDGTTSMKIVNYIERHNFCWNDLLTKSNRTEIQTYKLEERTFGTPCAAVEGLTQAILSFFF